MPRASRTSRATTPIWKPRRGGADALRAAAVLGTSLLASGPAHADPVLAETLFQTGRAALAAGDLATACPKLAESQRLDPAGGTALLLGLCLERQGKTASAWAALEDALSFALREHNDERAEVARRHLSALSPRLARVSIRVRAPRPDDLVVRRDGQPIPASALDLPIPLDPGEHVVRAEAAGFDPSSSTITLSPVDEGKTREIVLELSRTIHAEAITSPASTPSAAPPPPPPSPQRSPTMAAAPWVLAGLGAAIAGVGAVFGVRAMDKMHDVRRRCPASPCADAGARALHDEAGRDADVATLAIASGAALATGGVVWGLLRTPESTQVALGGRF